jgi:hypothetical protein
LNLYLAGTSVPQVPTWPGVPSNLPAGADPALSIPTDLRGAPGGTVLVPVNIDDPHPAGSRGLTQAVLALRYDPAVFDVSAADIRLGDVPAAAGGWTLQAVVDPLTGQIGIILFSATPIGSAQGGSLVTIALHVRPGAAAGLSAVNLVPAVSVHGRVLHTALSDDLGALTLHPAPTDAAADPGVDGRIVVVPTGPAPAATIVSAAQARADAAPRQVEQFFGDLGRGGSDVAGLLLAGGRSGGLVAPSAVPSHVAELLGAGTGAAHDWLQGFDLALLGRRESGAAAAGGRARPQGVQDLAAALTVLDEYFARTADTSH